LGSTANENHWESAIAGIGLKRSPAGNDHHLLTEKLLDHAIQFTQREREVLQLVTEGRTIRGFQS